jgi:hypothetical protein
MRTFSLGFGNTITQLGDVEIPKAAIDAIVDSDPELSWTNPADAGGSEGPPDEPKSISWRGKARFTYKPLWIQCDDPDKSETLKLLDIARALNGHLFNEKGDRLELGKKGMFGGQTIVTIPD